MPLLIADFLLNKRKPLRNPLKNLEVPPQRKQMSSKYSEAEATVVPFLIKKDGRAGRRVKKVYSKVCPNCKTPFVGVQKQRFCTESCKGEYKYKTKRVTTDTQYKNISGNWERYFKRLLNKKGRESLSIQDVLSILEAQDYKCALSGVTLTCQLEVGKKFKTNASLDRIEAGGPYIKENLHLVCSALNSWRADTELSEFLWWCKKVTECQEKEGS